MDRLQELLSRSTLAFEYPAHPSTLGHLQDDSNASASDRFMNNCIYKVLAIMRFVLLSAFALLTRSGEHYSIREAK